MDNVHVVIESDTQSTGMRDRQGEDLGVRSVQILWVLLHISSTRITICLSLLPLQS